MARNINNNLLNDLKNYLKVEWLKNGQQKFSKTIKQIAVEIYNSDKNSLTSKIWIYLKKLENAGYIKVEQGNERGNPNWYTWINDNIIAQLSEQREEVLETIDDLIDNGNNFIKKMSDVHLNMSQELIQIKGELHIYRQLISELESFSTTPDGKQILIAPKGSNIISVINSLKNKNENEKENETKKETV